MPRLFLLLLSIILGVLVFICSQNEFQMPLIAKTSGKIQMKTFEPFYYAAFEIPSSVEDITENIDQFQAEFMNQNLSISHPILIFRPLQSTEKIEWIVAAKVSESVSIRKPLFKAKWNWQHVLVWNEKEKYSSKIYPEKLSSYLKEHQLFAVGPLVEIYRNSSENSRQYWLPVGKEVGN